MSNQTVPKVDPIQEKTIKVVGARCFSMMLSDQPWKDLGFSKRPKYGALVAKFFAQWKVALNEALVKELVVVFSVTYFHAQIIKREHLTDLVKFYVFGPGPQPSELWRSFGFLSSNDAERFFYDSIALYLDTPINDWYGLLAKRCGFMQVPDKALQAKLLVNGTQFISTIQTMATRPDLLKQGL